MAESYAIVVDLGSHEIKAGFSYAFPSEEEPRLVTPTTVKNTADASKPIHPIQSGEIKDWDALESLLYYTLYDQLGWTPGGEGSLMMVEPAMTSREDREKLAQLMFEVFNVNSYFATDSAVASMYSTGKTSGLVVDIGYDKIDIAPVLEGMILPSAACRLPYGGHQITLYLQDLLHQRGMTSITEELAEEIKKACIHIASDEHDESIIHAAKLPQHTVNSAPATHGDAHPDTVSIDNNNNNKHVYSSTYTLPDGESISIETEGKLLGEALLNPSLLGLDLPLLVQSLQTAGLVTTLHGEKDARKVLAENILVCGGSGIVPGLGDRLLKEMKATSHPSLAPSLCQIPAYMPRYSAQRAAWMGGAALAKFVFGGQAPNQAQQAVMKVEYEEYGPYAVHRKCS